MSFGATEQTFPNAGALLGLRSAFQNANRHGVTLLAASGDTGATDYELNLEDLYPFPVTSWPPSDPLVTGVGGTMLTLDDNGNRLAPDVVWNDGFGAGGSGLSTVFGRPDFQDGVRSIVGHQRGVPDISMSAAVDGAVVYYESFAPTGTIDGTCCWDLIAGTSEASPEFAGIVADATQVARHRLGNINDALYGLASLAYSHGSHGNATGLVDVTQGDTTFGPFTNTDGNTYTVQGTAAGPGYDLASGVGTIDAARFVPALAFASSLNSR
jgi:subtilase family serine protease